ncbi:MAG TPA: tetratricopeptide repeat protein [Chitinophagaceae bacterium]|nr:tetratricopeptide repeat protein [Chitinophagaceae bacterium]
MKQYQYRFVFGLCLISCHFSFAQKDMETKAAIEYNNLIGAFQSQNMQGAKEIVIKATDYIDKAAANPETKDSPKTLYLKGEIYFYALMLKGMYPDLFPGIPDDEWMNSIIASWKKAFTIADKYDTEIERAVWEKKGFTEQWATAMFKDKKYKEAMKFYDMDARLSTAINRIDTATIFYAGLCAEYASDWNNASKYYTACANYGYRVPEIYKQLASALVEAGKNQEAIVYLEKAIQFFPDDKQLYYLTGSLYMNASQKDKAEQYLRKAIEIDPAYTDAQLQLGNLLYSIGADIYRVANLSPNDPSYNKKINESDYYCQQALPLLEMYIKTNPNDKFVLQSIIQICVILGLTEKYYEYRKRYETQ